jgi:hypothetical protein
MFILVLIITSGVALITELEAVHDNIKCMFQFLTIYLLIYGRLAEKLAACEEELCSIQLVPTHRAC